MYNFCNYGIKYSNAQNTTATALIVNFLLCPSEVKTDRFKPANGPSNYAWNMGTWLVWKGYSSPGNDGMFGVNFGRTISGLTDGTGNTVAGSEKKTQSPSLRGCSGTFQTEIPTKDEMIQIVTGATPPASPPRTRGEHDGPMAPSTTPASPWDCRRISRSSWGRTSSTTTSSAKTRTTVRLRSAL